LPTFEGGLFAELIYGNQPRVISDLSAPEDEPAAEYLEGMRSLVALPLYDKGESLNMVVRLWREPDGFDLDNLPDQIIMSNLFGRATHNLVLAEELRHAYEALDAEFKAIAEIQQSLLPTTTPEVRGLEVAAHYETAHRAGGDYYDCIDLPGGRAALLIADVSGHGAAAAVVMARMHATLHAYRAELDRPAEVLRFINNQLLVQCARVLSTTTFVTAFYGVYDPTTRSLTYASAGHNPPRWRNGDGHISSIAGARGLPLAIDCGMTFDQACLELSAGDEIVLYTDGIVETVNPRGDMFGIERLDEVIVRPHPSAVAAVEDIVRAVDDFREDALARDDRTLLVLRVAP
jgi:sigma-B regulation protein RsbU (phosphoserine phosphatase)